MMVAWRGSPGLSLTLPSACHPSPQQEEDVRKGGREREKEEQRDREKERQREQPSGLIRHLKSQ